MQKQKVLGYLEGLIEREEESSFDSMLARAWAYYNEHDVMTPSLLGVIVWRSDVYGVTPPLSLMSVCLRKHAHRDQILAMPAWRVKKIWPALSRAQQVRIKSLHEEGHLLTLEGGQS